MKATITKLSIALFVLATVATASAQTPGQYKLLGAGTKGDEKGYCGIGTIVIKADRSVSVTSKNPADKEPAATFTGKAGSNPFTLNGPGSQKMRIRVIYSGPKYIYGTYTRLSGSTTTASGEFSATRR